MKPKSQERGQALVIIALAVVGLFGFAALAIDGSRVFSDRRHAQNAADTAALSAALAHIRHQDYVKAAKDRAADNGYAIDANIEVAFCNTLSSPDVCQGIPTHTSTPPTTEELELTNPANYIRVKITSILPATFARIVGRQEFKNVMSAIAYAGPVEPKPLVDGYALAAMERHAWDAVFSSGNINVDINNSGIFSNSAYASSLCQHGSMRTGGNGTISVDTSINTVGNFCPGQNSNIQAPAVNEGVGAIDDPPLVDLPNFSCGSTNGSVSTDSAGRLIVSPGNHGNLNFPLASEVIFSPGTHCFNNGLTMNGADFTADNVNFLFKGGEFKLTFGTMTCNDLLVHVNGGSGITFTGTGHIYCNNVTFFLSTGDVRWNGDPEYRLYAPVGGDYDGLLFYVPPSNSNSIRINGNATCEMTGTILGISSAITVNGNNWTNGLNSQIIGNTVSLEGNGKMVINYVPDDQFQPIDPSAIMLTK
jgi:Putative Flp pilus-assembly TadE/G-like